MYNKVLRGLILFGDSHLGDEVELLLVLCLVSSPDSQIHPPLVADDADGFRDNLSNPLFAEEGGGEGYTPIGAGLPSSALPRVGAVEGRRFPGRREPPEPTDRNGKVGL